MADDGFIHDKKTNSLVRGNEFGLTEKQETFARMVANGSTLKEAYERAYDTENMAKASIYTEASKLMDHPLVAKRVRQLADERASKTHANDAKRIRQHVFDRLMMESVDDESPPTARIRALELLGKIDVVSMFKEAKGPADTEKEDVASLEARLRALLGKMVNVTPIASANATHGAVDISPALPSGTKKATEDDDA